MNYAIMFAQIVNNAISERFVSLLPQSPELLVYSSGILTWLRTLGLEELAPHLVYQRAIGGGIAIELNEELPNPNEVRLSMNVEPVQEITSESSRTIGADIKGSISSAREDLPVRMVSLGVGYRLEPSLLVPDGLDFLYANEVLEQSHVSIVNESQRLIRKERGSSAQTKSMVTIGVDTIIDKATAFDELKHNAGIIVGKIA